MIPQHTVRRARYVNCAYYTWNAFCGVCYQDPREAVFVGGNHDSKMDEGQTNYIS